MGFVIGQGLVMASFAFTSSNLNTLAMERMAARIPHARYVCIEGAGHLVHLEQPARFNAALLEFLT